MILVVLLIVSLLINGTQAVRAYRKRNKPSNDGPSPDRTVAMDSNPCYEASTVKQTEADQEAVHVYEMVKQHCSSKVINGSLIKQLNDCVTYIIV